MGGRKRKERTSVRDTEKNIGAWVSEGKKSGRVGEERKVRGRERVRQGREWGGK